MARSSHVYLVAEVNYEGDNIVAAFTVKHECKTWLARNPRTGLSREIIRLPDGGRADTTRWLEEEFG